MGFSIWNVLWSRVRDNWLCRTDYAPFESFRFQFLSAVSCSFRYFQYCPADSLTRYLICLTIGPAFMTAAIYLCLGRIITAYGRNLSRFTPRTYTFVFIGCDFVSLVLQAVGGALTSTSSDEQASNIGVDVMVAGLSFQIFSLAIFMGFCAEFAWRVKHNSPALRESKLKSTRETWQFRGFLWGKASRSQSRFML
jgi:hypothetical protein